jgi:hypothetical protein
MYGTSCFQIVLENNLPVPGLWIRIRIGSGFSDFLDPDPYWESGSRGKKIKKFQRKNALFSYLKKNFTTKKV